MMLIKTGSQKPVALVVTLLLLALPCPAQENNFAKVDEYLKAEMQKQQIPGLSLVIIKDGQIVYARGHGLANVEHQVAVRPETIFQSGSVGKQFTAAAVMLLVEDGKTGLDDRITKYFADAPAQWQNITVRHLLTHTAGTTDYTPDFDFRRDYTEDELLKKAAAIPLAFQPGERWSYSNLGYIMLGILISKVTGKFYGEFLQERIFKPLGMTTARIINEADIIPNRSSGYRLIRGELKHQEWVAPKLNTTADGSLYLTLYDMAKWDAALYGEKLLKKSSLEQIWTPVKLNNGKTYPYGFGWMLRNANGHRLIEHGGAWQGFKAHIARYVDDKLTIVLFANLAQTNPERLAHDVAALCDARLVSVDEQARAEKISAMLKDVLTKSIHGSVSPDAFTTEARAELFPEKIRQIGEALKPLGAIRAVTLGGRTEEDGVYSYRRYRIAGDGKFRMCRVKLTSQDKLAALELMP
jgi:CubicO group peptidase (beta-lactamase class C family)